jgi:DNA-binding NarL/FixJ family response regulator
MGDLGKKDRERLRELQSALGTVAIEEDLSLAGFIGDIGELVGVPRACAYSLEQRVGSADGQHLAFSHVSGIEPAGFTAIFSSFVERQTVNWALYNTSRPEPSQRNVVLAYASAAAAQAATASGLQTSPIAKEVFTTLGVFGHDQVRVLVCDGPSMLAWVGGWQPAPFEERQKQLLAALVPSLRSRLLMERTFHDGARLPLLDAALEAIAGAAVVVDCQTGRVREANAAARARLDVEKQALRNELAAAAAAEAHPSWARTLLRLRAGGTAALLVATAVDDGSAGVERAARRWSLTPRQRQVFAEVAAGHSNRTIAAVLACSERTVEVHLTAIFERAQVESRAALIVAAFKLR